MAVRVAGPRCNGVRRLVPVAALVAIALLTACSAGSTTTNPSSAGTSPGTSAPGTDGSGSTVTPAVENFSGSDADFYVPPSPLPSAPPGTLIRTMALADGSGVSNLKIMYHSRDEMDRDRAVTAVVTYPTGAAPADGWPVSAFAPGTRGIAAQCGITHTLDSAPDSGVQGVRVITDYIGLGVVGGPPHPYFGRKSEGHSVIDSVRAVRNLPDVHASNRWLSIGHSQGGHAALSAHELSGTYAPELELLGTLALAPGSMLDRVYGGADPIVTSILTVLSLYGAAGERPEIKVDDYVTPELKAKAGVLETGCLDDIVNELVPLALEGKLFTTDPRDVEPTKTMVAENEVGDTPADAPVFLVSGTKDDRVVIERALDLYARLCAAGQVTQVLIIDGADHSSIIPLTADRTAGWLDARVAGEPTTSSCGDPAATTPRA